VKFRSPGTLGTIEKKRKKKKSSSQSLRGCSRSSVRTRWFRSPICYYPHYLCIPTDTHPRIHFQSYPPELILMFKHMLICPNEARVIITAVADRHTLQVRTIRNSKEYLPQKHTHRQPCGSFFLYLIVAESISYHC
jgi:hypothetical protein